MPRARVVYVLLVPFFLCTACSDDDSGGTTTDGGDDAADAGGGPSADDTAGAADGTGDAADSGAPDGTGDGSGEVSRLILSGQAAGEDEDTGERVSCAFTGVFDRLTETETGWTGRVAFGEVFRDIFVGEAPTASFQALVGGDVSLTEAAGGVELRWVGDQTEGPRFWAFIEVLEGTEDAQLTYSGTWQCAPIDINEPGYSDYQTIVDGTWELAPEEPEPE